ncbi:MAG TPA: hypothetical protein VKB62_09630 [Streptosporangiaceae bacterium]|nr:hypothetical protein [Streptosporangiaceae bacterium]
MSTANEREAALRRALLSAAEYIEPAPGGLERIQGRLGRPRPPLVARLEAAWTVVQMRAPDVIEAIRRRAAKVLRLVWERFGPDSAPRQGPRWLNWLRPLVAMSVAVFVIGAGVYIGLASPEGSIVPTDGVPVGTPGSGGSQPGGPGHGGQGAPAGNGSLPGDLTAPSQSGSPSCSPSLTPYNPGHVSSGAPIVSGSPTPNPSGSTTPPPSPTPSTSTSSDPSNSTAPSGAAPGAGLTSGNPGANAGTGTGASNGGVSGSLRTHHTARHSTSQSAAPSSGTNQPSSNGPKYNPCASKSSGTHHKTTTSASTAPQTSAKLTQTQPGKAVAAKLY